MELYIHPKSEQIQRYIEELNLRNMSLEDSVITIFKWFDKHIIYSRLNALFFPLQRSDIDVLEMMSGTCGDYSNLLVSVFSTLGYKVKYAYLKIDCYGNPQDHICIAVFDENRWKLIDATQPYRKWHGFDCPHKEYKLYSSTEFLEKMKVEEKHWVERANEMGNKRYAGLLYAPWIFEDTIKNENDLLETVFYLLILDSPDNYKLYVNYFVYSREIGITPIMCRIENKIIYYRFSVKKAKHIWDEEQWSNEYIIENIPNKYQTEYLVNVSKSINRNIEQIHELVLFE